MKKLFFFVGSILFFLGACAPSYRTQTYNDNFDNFNTFTVQDNILWSECTDCGDIELNPQKFVQEEVSYKLIVEFTGEDFINIREGESVVLLIDDERVALSGAGSQNTGEVIDRNTVTEFTSFDVSPRLIIDIAEAEEVRLRLTGGRYFFEREFRKDNFYRFQRFVDQHIN